MQSRMGPVCFTKKALNCPSVLEKTRVFSPMMWMNFGVLDAAWVTSSLLSTMPNFRQCCLPESCRQPRRQRSALRMP